MLDEMSKLFRAGGLGFLAGEDFRRSGLGFLSLRRGDTLRAGGEDEGFELFVIHVGDFFFKESMKGDFGVEMLKVLGGLVH